MGVFAALLGLALLYRYASGGRRATGDTNMVNPLRPACTLLDEDRSCYDAAFYQNDSLDTSSPELDHARPRHVQRFNVLASVIFI